MNKLKKNLVLTGMMGVREKQRLENPYLKDSIWGLQILMILLKKKWFSISEIFENRGEKAFRQEEEVESKNALKKQI